MEDDPGKNRATWRAIFYTILVYCGAYVFLRLGAVLPQTTPTQKNYLVDIFYPLHRIETIIKPFIPKKL